MNDHDICRRCLRSAIQDIESSDPRRRVTTEVTGDVKMGNSHHYWVKVSDTRPPSTGSSFPGGGTESGHARFMDYEVEACCRYSARMKAIDEHIRTFDRKEEEP